MNMYEVRNTETGAQWWIQAESTDELRAHVAEMFEADLRNALEFRLDE